MRITLFLFIIFGFFSESLSAQHTNIVIDAKAQNYANEPSIIIDPNNTNRMIAASNINNYYYSADGGSTWESGKLSSTYGVWGDPALAVDTAGHFYFFHLSNPSFGSWIDRIVCQKTTDLGQSWSDGSFMGLNGSKAQDKEWPVIDRRNNHIYITWTQFDDYGSQDSADSSHIMFSRSLDGGVSWSDALRIDQHGGDCVDDDDTVEGAVPTVGPNGEIYVSWVGPKGLVFDKSYDQGLSWLEEDIFVADVPGGWNYAIPGIMRCNGLPVTHCDTSGGDYNGTLYINWTDQRNGIDDTDVWLVRSTDDGESWSEPFKVNNDDSKKHQFLSWMDIDQTNGYIYIVFYDRRNYQDTNTDVYLARSTDGGQSFKNFKISESPFVPNSGIFFGDYTNISAHDDVVRPIWTRLHEGKLQIFTALVDTDSLTTATANIPRSRKMELEQNYPNPYKSETYISFKLHQADTLDLLIFDNSGTVVADIFTQKQFKEGKHVLQISDKLHHLKSGLYYYVLRSDKLVLKKKMIQLE